MYPLAILSGAATAIVVSTLLGIVVSELVRQPLEPDPPVGFDPSAWKLIKDPGAAGAWIGALERLLYIAAFWIGMESVIAGWLAFKLASKWESWKNVVQAPASLEPQVDNVAWFAARARLGSWILSKFWIGTLGNLLAGFAAAAVGKYVAQLFH